VAATIPEYVDILLRRQIAAADRLGVQMLLVDRQLYDVNLTLLTLVGVLMKALNDKGVVLDAEWQTRLNAALQGNWPAWILSQTDPNAPAG
jgi:hypothetical protein